MTGSAWIQSVDQNPDVWYADMLALDEPPSAELLAIMRDIAPLLVSIREKDGAKYVLGYPDFSVQLRQIDPTACQELVKSWQKAIDEDFRCFE